MPAVLAGRPRDGARPPQLHHVLETELQALFELVGGGERRRVVAEGHGARARPRDEYRHHGHPGHRPHPVLPVHPGPGQERLLGVARHVAGLDVRRRDPLDDLVQRLVGEQAEDGRETADHVNGRLAPARDHLLAYLPHPVGGVGFADRRGDGDAGEPVARGRVVAGAQADRQGQREGVDRHAEHLVVPAQAAAQRGEVGVVDRGSHRLGRGAQVGERQLEHEGPGDQAPAAQQGRRRGRRRAEHAAGRVGEAEGLGDRSPRSHDQTAHGTRRAAQQLAPGGQRRLRPLPEAVAQQVVAGQVARHRHRRHRPRLSLPLGVVDLLEQGDPAEPVGDRVAELDHHRSPAVFQALDVQCLPQGARGVQRRLQRDLGQVEELAQRARGGQRHPAQVVVQVEVGVDDPARRRRREGRDHDLLPHPDDHPAGPVHRLVQPAQSAGRSRISRFRNADRVAGYASPRCKR